MSEGLEKKADDMSEGTAFVVLGHQNENWIDDGNRYWFPAHAVGAVEIVIRKPEPRRLWVTLTGVWPEPFMVDVAVPSEVKGGKIIVVVRWRPNEVDVKINNYATSGTLAPVDDYYKTPADQGKAVRPEEVYLKKVDEMQVRAGLGTHYDLVTAAAILRHLFIDGDRLVDQLTRSRQSLRPLFEVMRQRETGFYGDEPEPVVNWTLIDPAGLSNTDPLRVTVKLKHFLAMRCLRFRGAHYTVHDIISSCANVRGGVHFSRPDDTQQSLIDLDDIARTGGVEISVSCIGGIVNVARTALEPLTQAIRKELSK